MFSTPSGNSSFLSSWEISIDLENGTGLVGDALSCVQHISVFISCLLSESAKKAGTNSALDSTEPMSVAGDVSDKQITKSKSN